MAKNNSEAYKGSKKEGLTTNPSEMVALTENQLELTPEWAARYLIYASNVNIQNSFFAEKLAKYRAIDLGMCDVAELKNFFDPGTQGEKKADIVLTDWRPNPLIFSLNQIVQKNIEGIPVELRVMGSDKLSQDKKATKKLRIKTRRATIDLFNMVRAATNDMPLPESTNPETVALGGDVVNESLSLIDRITQEATDDFDFTILNEAGALKDAVEIAHEQSISYYFNECKFKDNLSFQLISDSMKVATSAYRFYTSAMNGLPQVQYIDLSFLKSSAFKKRDGEDMDYWYYQTVVTWSEYMQMVGGKLSEEENKRIYERNRTYFYMTAGFPEWQFAGTLQGTAWTSYQNDLMQTRMNIGYFEVKKNVYDDASGKYYDIIKKFYFLPFAPVGYDEKYGAENILDFGTLQDQYRHGNNLSLAKFSLVIWRDVTKQSFYDVQQGDFLRLNLLYNHYLNTLANFTPEGTSFAEETITELAEQLQQEEEDYMEQMGQSVTAQSLAKFRSDIIRNFKLTGRGIFKLKKGDNNEISLDKPTFINENNVMQNLTEIFQQMFAVYNSMLNALGINQTRLAQDPKPRQVASGIETATAASYFSTESLEQSYTYHLRGFGERMLYYNQQVIGEFNDKGEPTTERAKELQAILSSKGIIPLEVYSEMPYQRCILRVDNLPSAQDRLGLMAVTQGYEQLGVVPPGTLLMAQEIQNFKLAKLFVVFMIRKYQREKVESQQELMAQQQQGQQQALATQAQLEEQKRKQEYDLEARNNSINNEQKTKGQVEVKSATLESRKEEDDHKTGNELQKMAAEEQMKTY